MPTKLGYFTFILLIEDVILKMGYNSLYVWNTEQNQEKKALKELARIEISVI